MGNFYHELCNILHRRQGVELLDASQLLISTIRMNGNPILLTKHMITYLFDYLIQYKSELPEIYMIYNLPNFLSNL